MMLQKAIENCRDAILNANRQFDKFCDLVLFIGQHRFHRSSGPDDYERAVGIIRTELTRRAAICAKSYFMLATFLEDEDQKQQVIDYAFNNFIQGFYLQSFLERDLCMPTRPYDSAPEKQLLEELRKKATAVQQTKQDEPTIVDSPKFDISYRTSQLVAAQEYEKKWKQIETYLESFYYPATIPMTITNALQTIEYHLMKLLIEAHDYNLVMVESTFRTPRKRKG